MTAKSWPTGVNSLILIAVLFAAWQLLFEFAGSQAMTAPVETFRYLAHLLTTAAFWGHVEETSRAFFFALLLAVLLGLIIGFTFQMAISRYDQRKTYEREEANAIGTDVKIRNVR